MSAAALLVAAPQSVWFGPAEVPFELETKGNPYDASVNDVRVSFKGPGGTIQRMAFFDRGKWKVRLVSRKPGRFTLSATLNGKPVRAKFSKQVVDLKQTIKGYVTLDKASRKFYLDGKTPYWPLGHNLGWNAAGTTVEKQLGTMSTYGLNWSRIWACSWDGKNPFVAQSGPNPPMGELLPDVLDRWDSVVTAAEKANVKFQFVLFHHGLFSSRVNPNWPDHPWNKAKGGFLEKASAFFTDPQANKLSANWLRYAVARWGHSPSIMAWELFNEVEWVDAKYENLQNTIGDWHEKNYAYLRKIDPVGRLVTSSSEMYLPIYKGADYYQPHGYPASVENMVLSATVPKDKPFFYGEVGSGTYVEALERGVVRDSAWSGFFAGHAGASQYWYWDRLVSSADYQEFARAAKIIKGSGLTHAKNARTLSLKSDAPSGGDLVVNPGIGWGETKTTHLNLPEDANIKAGLLSSYFQGTANRNLFPKPLTLRITSPKATTLQLSFGPISKGGADIEVKVNGAVTSSQKVGPREADGEAMEATASLPSGVSEVTITNSGADWAQIKSIVVKGLGESLRVIGRGDGRTAVIRVRRKVEKPFTTKISGLGLKNGSYRVVTTDLDSGKVSTEVKKISQGTLSYAATAKDAAVQLLPAK